MVARYRCSLQSHTCLHMLVILEIHWVEETMILVRFTVSVIQYSWNLSLKKPILKGLQKNKFFFPHFFWYFIFNFFMNTILTVWQAMTVKTASSAPAAPRRWPVAPLVEDTARWLLWEPNTRLTAMFSMASPEEGSRRKSYKWYSITITQSFTCKKKKSFTRTA